MKTPRAISLSASLISLALAAGCATVRTPVTSFEEPISVSSPLIEPHLELWVESSEPISEKQQAAAAQDARAALADVVSAHEILAHAHGATDPLLIVREQAVARTDQRRTNQKVAAAGIVVGAALVAVAIIAGAHSGSHFSSGAGHVHASSGVHVASASSFGARAVPVHAGGVAAGPIAFAHPGPRGAFYGGGRGWNRYPVHRYGWNAAATAGEISVDLVDPSIDLAIELNYAQEQAAFAEADREARFAPPGEDDEAGDEELPTPPPPPELNLPALPPIHLEQRGFFDGDDTILEVDLFDRASGELLWSNVVRSNIDARSRDDVDDLFVRALDKASWAQDK